MASSLEITATQSTEQNNDELAKRETYLQADIVKLSNQNRFLKEVTEKSLQFHKRRECDVIRELEEREYTKDPIRIWKETYEPDNVENHLTGDYDYLLKMPLIALVVEMRKKLVLKRDEKLQELENLNN